MPNEFKSYSNTYSFDYGFYEENLYEPVVDEDPRSEGGSLSLRSPPLRSPPLRGPGQYNDNNPYLRYLLEPHQTQHTPQSDSYSPLPSQSSLDAPQDLEVPSPAVSTKLQEPYTNTQSRPRTLYRSTADETLGLETTPFSSSSPPPPQYSTSRHLEVPTIATATQSTGFGIANGGRASSDRSRSRPNSVAGLSLYEDEQCEDCRKSGSELSYCNVCTVNRLAPGSVPHEKTNSVVARKIQRVLVPTSDQGQRTQLHEDDEKTAWFGIDRPDAGPPMFQDYGRYADLLSATEEDWTLLRPRSQVGRDSRTPSLISFVGQTGAGKSTLIKLIIDLTADDDQSFGTPVVGESGVAVPTSEDVHLYSDPSTASSEAPIFYADCEGLQGGEREPLGAKLKRSRRHAERQSRERERESKSRRPPGPSSERELCWASSTALASREFAVTNLYPRLLYTFSDVIVFVLKNPRVIESVFEQLVNWAAAALEMSSNQPVLPHAIIALNASENDIDPAQWDIDTASSTLLDSISRTVFHNPTFKKYAQEWRERKKEIESVEQLMLSYYSSIRVVRIPAQGRPQLIRQQIGGLYETIMTACSAARVRKAQLRMLLDAEELQSYLQYAFDHFALTLDRPFDFVQASFSNSPIPLDFGGNILKLAINLMQVWENRADVQMIFQELSYMVASCIMLDSARHKIRGTAAEIFPQYLPHLDAALENFCDKHWPCEYVHTGGGLRCVNVRSGHSKGHQLSTGKVFAVGDYQSRWTFERLLEEFRCNVYFRLEEVLQRLKSRMTPGEDEERIAAEIHRDDVMAWFYRHVSGGERTDKYNSHSVCFCCLSEPPEHALPCGHVLCSQCIKTYGDQLGRTEIKIQGCPLESCATQPYQSWRIHLKPESAGVRVLTLDGGGIRGIVELEILRQIEREMNGNLSIQCFFDLIVGTSTGGIVALGLAARNWTVDTCIHNFEELCEKAFTRRTGGNLPVIGWFVDNFNHSKFATEPLKEALQTAFTEEEYLFGGPRSDHSWGSSTKVAVTATIASKSPVVLANYNRRCDEKLSYQFQRPEGIASELKTWEAARATSAAPRIFKPFHHERSKQVYMDGGLYHNNPVKIADRERKLIWNNDVCNYPDLMLSIGTSYNVHARTASIRRPPMRLGVFAHGKSLVNIAKDHIEESLDCEKTWNDFVGALPPNAPNTASRFVRLNVPLYDDPPALDDVHKMKNLQETVRKQLARDSSHIHRVAMQLVATCFYFETSKVQQFAQNSATASGRIYCRLADKSREVKELGKLIRAQSPSRNPYFYIRETNSHNGCQRDLSPDVIGKMIQEGSFVFRNINIEMDNKLSETEIWLYLNERESYLISGFPRCLFQDENDRTKKLDPLTTNTHRWAGRSNSQQSRRKLWTPPDRAGVTRRTTIQSYSDPDHVIGHATAEEVRLATQSFSRPAEIDSGVVGQRAELDSYSAVAELAG